MTLARGSARGFTLVEFTIVAGLGALIVLSLSTFYLNAQSMWIDSSVQAVTQRDATLFMERMEQVIGEADQAVLNNPHQLSLLKREPPGAPVGTQIALIDWDGTTDHATITTGMDGTPKFAFWPATGTLKALQFRMTSADARVVYLDSLRINTPAGEPVYFSTCFALFNKP